VSGDSENGGRGPFSISSFNFQFPQTGFYAVVLRSFAVNYSLIVLEILVSSALKIKGLHDVVGSDSE